MAYIPLIVELNTKTRNYFSNVRTFIFMYGNIFFSLHIHTRTVITIRFKSSFFISHTQKKHDEN